jgi:hypothetical protein
MAFGGYLVVVDLKVSAFPNLCDKKLSRNLENESHKYQEAEPNQAKDKQDAVTIQDKTCEDSCFSHEVDECSDIFVELTKFVIKG